MIDNLKTGNKDLFRPISTKHSQQATSTNKCLNLKLD